MIAFPLVGCQHQFVTLGTASFQSDRGGSAGARRADPRAALEWLMRESCHRPARARERRRRGALLLLALLTTVACSTPKPDEELAVTGVEAYWAIDQSAGDTVYVAPVVRFQLTNKSARQAIEATATFRHKGDSATWGSAWERVTLPQKPLPPGRTITLALRSDGRYYTTGAPETVFAHKLFKDASVEVFLRVGSSPWVKMATADVERRIGSKSLEEPAPSPSPQSPTP